ncbi:hypothetical protein HKX48_007138 [Thoreauomyces humboldtii]|nr:hypothetical protein HKX48_007138 [Thoreauomyces humboldtii]
MLEKVGSADRPAKVAQQQAAALPANEASEPRPGHSPTPSALNAKASPKRVAGLRNHLNRVSVAYQQILNDGQGFQPGASVPSYTEINFMKLLNSDSTFMLSANLDKLKEADRDSPEPANNDSDDARPLPSESPNADASATASAAQYTAYSPRMTRWLRSTVGLPSSVPVDADAISLLQTGDVLCRLACTLYPRTQCQLLQKGPEFTVHKVIFFLELCKTVGVKNRHLFAVADLLVDAPLDPTRRSGLRVLKTICALERQARKQGWLGPALVLGESGVHHRSNRDSTRSFQGYPLVSDRGATSPLPPPSVAARPPSGESLYSYYNYAPSDRPRSGASPLQALYDRHASVMSTTSLASQVLRDLPKSPSPYGGSSRGGARSVSPAPTRSASPASFITASQGQSEWEGEGSDRHSDTGSEATVRWYDNKRISTPLTVITDPLSGDFDAMDFGDMQFESIAHIAEESEPGTESPTTPRDDHHDQLERKRAERDDDEALSPLSAPYSPTSPESSVYSDLLTPTESNIIPYAAPSISLTPNSPSFQSGEPPSIPSLPSASSPPRSQLPLTPVSPLLLPTLPGRIPAATGDLSVHHDLGKQQQRPLSLFMSTPPPSYPLPAAPASPESRTVSEYSRSEESDDDEDDHSYYHDHDAQPILSREAAAEILSQPPSSASSSPPSMPLPPAPQGEDDHIHTQSRLPPSSPLPPPPAASALHTQLPPLWPASSSPAERPPSFSLDRLAAPQALKLVIPPSQPPPTSALPDHPRFRQPPVGPQPSAPLPASPMVQSGRALPDLTDLPVRPSSTDPALAGSKDRAMATAAKKIEAGVAHMLLSEETFIHDLTAAREHLHVLIRHQRRQSRPSSPSSNTSGSSTSSSSTVDDETTDILRHLDATLASILNLHATLLLPVLREHVLVVSATSSEPSGKPRGQLGSHLLRFATALLPVYAAYAVAVRSAVPSILSLVVDVDAEEDVEESLVKRPVDWLRSTATEVRDLVGRDRAGVMAALKMEMCVRAVEGALVRT